MAGIQFAIMGPEIVRQLIEAGIDLETFAAFTDVGGVALDGGLCCLGGWGAGAALGAAVFAAIKQEASIAAE